MNTVKLFAAEPLDADGWAEAEGMDYWLDSLESMLTAIRQRRMTADQLDRYATLLLRAERHSLTLGRARSKRERAA